MATAMFFLGVFGKKLPLRGSFGGKSLRGLKLLGAGVSGILGLAELAYADGAENGLACPIYPWPSRSILGSYDPALTQPYRQNFRNDCASCHVSLTLDKGNNGVVNSKENGFATFSEIEVTDGQRDELMMLPCSPKFSTYFSHPHSFKQSARFTRGSTHPSDLSLITKIGGVTKNLYSSGSIAVPKLANSGPLPFEDVMVALFKA